MKLKGRRWWVGMLVALGGVVVLAVLARVTAVRREPLAAQTSPEAPAAPSGTAEGLRTTQREHATSSIDSITLPPAQQQPGGELLGKARSMCGVVVDTLGTPLVNVQVCLFDASRHRLPQPPEQTNESGRFCFEQALENARPGHTDPRRAAIQEECLLSGEWRITVTQIGDYAGRVVDEAGHPVSSAKVRVRISPSYLRDNALPQLATQVAERWVTSVNEDGAFRLADVPAGDATEIMAWATGYLPVHRSGAGQIDDLLLVLHKAPEDVAITGFVLHPDGTPAPEATVATCGARTVTRMDGGFDLAWRPTAVFTFTGPNGDTSQLATHLCAAKNGYSPARVEFAGVDSSVPIVLQLSDLQSIRGHAVYEDGASAAGASICILDPTPLGTLIAGDVANVAFYAETLARRSAVVVADDGGAFNIGQLLPRAYQIVAQDDNTLASSRPTTVMAGASGVRLMIAAAQMLPIAGRVLTRTSQALMGAQVIPSRTGISRGIAPKGVVTDGEGHFAFAALETDGASLALAHPACILYSVELARFHDLQNIAIVVPDLCEAQVHVAAELGATNAILLDENRVAMNTFRLDAIGPTLWSTVPLVDGKSDIFRVHDTARWLVLYRRDAELSRVAVRVAPQGLTVLTD